MLDEILYHLGWLKHSSSLEYAIYALLQNCDSTKCTAQHMIYVSIYIYKVSATEPFQTISAWTCTLFLEAPFLRSRHLRLPPTCWRNVQNVEQQQGVVICRGMTPNY